MKKTQILHYKKLFMTLAIGALATSATYNATINATTTPDLTVSILVTNTNNHLHEQLVLLRENGNNIYSWFTQKNPVQAVNKELENVSKIQIAQQDIPPKEVTQFFMLPSGHAFIINLPQFISAKELSRRGARSTFHWVCAQALLDAPENGSVKTLTGKNITVDQPFLERFKKAWPQLTHTLPIPDAKIAAKRR
ncbi:MAG: hypothetical protein NT124_04260 [Candidatus Dependentiae bacterium]|nr:hypothetical protein [Candidatus Dependentiae bacterium]